MHSYGRYESLVHAYVYMSTMNFRKEKKSSIWSNFLRKSKSSCLWMSFMFCFSKKPPLHVKLFKCKKITTGQKSFHERSYVPCANADGGALCIWLQSRNCYNQIRCHITWSNIMRYYLTWVKSLMNGKTEIEKTPLGQT